MRRHRRTGSDPDDATFRALHLASQAAPALRQGLTAEGAARSVHHLRALLGAPAVALTVDDLLLAWDGHGGHHADEVSRLAGAVLRRGDARALTDRAVLDRAVLDPAGLDCGDAGCPVRAAVVVPLVVEDGFVGTLQVFAPATTPGLIRATTEVAQWVSGQLELAELDVHRARAAEAEIRALRAQISPHFIYNSLGAIASFVRTDPDRARELLLDFADFTRYSFRSHGEFTTLAEELRSIESYLALEKARFGDRLQVTLQVAPEVLPVAVPFLCIQPLVENAVQHGLEATPDKPDGVGRLTISARDVDCDCVIEVEDDGGGEDPERIRRILAGDSGIDSVGMANVDARLRRSFGEDYGLVVETAPGAGTKVVVRVPKFAAGVHA